MPTNGRRNKSHILPSRRERAACRAISEEKLESYVLGRLPGQLRGIQDDLEVETVEIHLLVCETCQTRDTALEAETQELRAILRRIEKMSKPKTFTAGAGGEWWLP
jgi:hypothetical protein